jgi:uncharacterized membrane protein YfcA
MVPNFAIYAALVGLAVGSLVGLTGMGGGALLVPLLVLVLRVPPIVAVGTGAAFAAVTKIGAAWFHWQQDHVDLHAVRNLAMGSAPGAALGVGLLSLLRSHYGSHTGEILKSLIGLLLISAPALIFIQERVSVSTRQSLRDRLPGWVQGRNGAILVGFIGGSLVGVTAVGSGSIIIVLLLLFFRRPPVVIVGTDVFHALILAFVATAGHLALGTVDFHLLGFLLLGSVPGALIGSHMTASIQNVWLRRILLSTVILAGAAMV